MSSVAHLRAIISVYIALKWENGEMISWYTYIKQAHTTWSTLKWPAKCVGVDQIQGK